MDQSKQIAAGITFLLMCVILLWLLLARMTWPPADWVPKTNTLTMETVGENEDEEEYVEVEVDPAQTVAAEESTPALNNEESEADSQPAPVTGFQEKSQGPVGNPPKPLTNTTPSEVKIEEKVEKEPKPTGPPVEELKKKAEENKAKQTAIDDVTNAFASANANGNTLKGEKDEGKAGSPSGDERTQTSQNGENFSTDGTIGGGWKFPKYSDKIPSNEAGRAIFDIEVKKDGSVGTVRCTRNEGLSERTIQNCIDEIKRRRFTNSNPAKAQSATAQLTIKFR